MLQTPSNRSAFLRRVNSSYLGLFEFRSMCETELHCDFKMGLAEASVLRLLLDNKNYYIHKKKSQCEKHCYHMGLEFETDCEYVFEKTDDLYEVLKTDEISFEIHHTSPVNEKKGLSYSLDGKVIVEFDINEMIQYFPAWARVKEKSPKDRVTFIREYLEDTSRHYIKGQLFKPFENKLVWTGLKSIVPLQEETDIEILVFRRDGAWRIIYKQGEVKPVYDNDYFGMPIKTANDAKLFAAYRVQEHLNGNKRLF